jgi:D-glycero-D-manno-heptose 1,7-bisphosphate phosphatase
VSSAPEVEAGAEWRAPSAPPRLRRAVFVDRDGTLVVDRHYMKDPGQIELLRGVAQGVSLLRAHHFPVIVVSNQSGIERGLYTQEDVEAIHRRIQELLAREGTQLDAFYYCPHAPETKCPCRKPGTALFERAAEERHLDLRSSAMLGDRGLDVEAGKELGMLTAYVPEPGAREHFPVEVLEAQGRADIFASSFLSACHRILARG